MNNTISYYFHINSNIPILYEAHKNEISHQNMYMSLKNVIIIQ